jgi:DNA replication protein DnaC
MNEQTLEKMKKMKLYGMLRNFKQVLESSNMDTLTADELVLQLIESEWEDRHNRAVNRSIGNAKFRYKASIESIDHSIERGLDQNIVNRLAECTFVKQAQNIIITGSTGTGKSYLASALGHQACIRGFKVYYANTLRLLTHLKMAKADGSSIKEFAYLEKQDILILDDFGIQPFDNQSRMILMDIVEDRHGKKSTIIAGQLPVGSWYDIIGDGTLADAILDRIVHDAHQIELNGESLRKKRNI